MKKISERTVDNNKYTKKITVFEYPCWCCGETKKCFCLTRGEKSCAYCGGRRKIRGTKSTTHSKYPCIGGPHAGETLATPGDDYLPYNKSFRDDELPKLLWIHNSLVPELTK